MILLVVTGILAGGFRRPKKNLLNPQDVVTLSQHNVLAKMLENKVAPAGLWCFFLDVDSWMG